MSRQKNTRKSRQQTKLPLWVIILVAAIACIVSLCDRPADADYGPVTAIDSLKRVAIPDETPEIYRHYEGFELSFNPQLHIPNYVSWELLGNETLGNESRRSVNFAADPDVLGSADPQDYRNSGYDRGHMAPAGDMKWSPEAMRQCHLLTNIVPQDHTLNAGPWKTLEENCRSWARRDSALIIICGPVLTRPIIDHIGRQQVAVPDAFFKVVYAPYAHPPRGIAFVMNNSNDNPGGVQPTAMTIRQAEQITGYDFLSALPDPLEEQVETAANYPLWQNKLLK